MQLNRRDAAAEETTPTMSEPLLKALTAVARQSVQRLLPPLALDRATLTHQASTLIPLQELQMAVLRADPLLAGQVLAAASDLEPAAELPEAVERLGQEGAWSILQASASAAPPYAAPFAEPAERLAAHSVAVAGLARRLAREDGMDEEIAYVAGLLHDVGRALMLQCVARLSRLPEVAAVLAVSGIEFFLDHPLADSLGQELVRGWGLSETIRDAVGYRSAASRPVGSSYAALVARAEATLAGGVNQHQLGDAPGHVVASEELESLRDCPAVA